MKLRLAFLAVTICAHAALAQDHHAAASKPATLLKGLGSHHHAIATTSKQAQRFFDQGLTLAFGFNHEEAIRSFQRAAELDPQAAMPQWGIAYALGPNYNMDVDKEHEQAAYAAAQKALALSANGPEHERAYIDALATRYSNDPNADLKQLNVAYKNAMAEVAKHYPDDLDAATIYAESAMILHPFKLWTPDGTPAEGTEEIVAVLEVVLRRDPNHPGANHFYIHAVEASPHPERALASAKRLETAVPAAGHLVHMPSHIYMRTGYYRDAAASNAAAVAADRAYLRTATFDVHMYPLMYFSHNIHFLAFASAMAGRRGDAIAAAKELYPVISPNAVELAGLIDPLIATRFLIPLRFQDWKEVLRAPEPDAKLAGAHGMWHFARGVARLGMGDAAAAEQERAALDTARQTLPDGAGFGFSTAADILNLAAAAFDARLAAAKGDTNETIINWQKAVVIEDGLAYNEPADWYYPVRESLGGALLRDGRYAEAEQVFRADLERNPRNPRSLFGLSEALKAQHKTAAADTVHAEFEVAWKNADSRLVVNDL